MRHRKRVFKVGRRPDHVRALLANQVCSLIVEKRIRTTVAKAKEVRRLAEKMITLGKRGTLHHRRLAIAKLHDVDAVHLLFGEIAPNYSERNGGYTRIIRLGTRAGDAAPMCYLEWVEKELVKKEPAPAKKAQRRKLKITSKKSEDPPSPPPPTTELTESPLQPEGSLEKGLPKEAATGEVGSPEESVDKADDSTPGPNKKSSDRHTDSAPDEESKSPDDADEEDEKSP